jgi:DNA primase
MPDFFEYSTLTDTEKRDLCVGLLQEFGVGHINEQSNGELIHSCCIPNTGHRNGDKNASASLNYKKLCFNCLGCGSSGGLLWFIAVCRGIEGTEAREWLGSQTGLGGKVMDLPRLLEVIDQIFHHQVEQAPIPRYDETVLHQWVRPGLHHPYLTTGFGGIRGRGIPPKTLDRFRVGYAGEYHDGTERIIIPHFWDGRLVGWQARGLPGHQGNDKYRSTPDFPKHKTLYNHARRRRIVLVESPMSVLRHCHHVPDLQATFGAAVTDAQLRLCSRYAEVTLWFDNDKAGWKATHHVAEELSRHVGVRVVDSPWDADPADLDDDLVEELIAEAVPYSIWERPRQLQEVH